MFKEDNLKELTREEKLLALDLLEEKKRRQRESIDHYKPNSGQTEVHKCPSKIRLVVSGNGAGKTVLGVHEAMWAVSGYHPFLASFLPVPRRVCVILDKPDKVADKWLPEIRKWFKLEPGWLHKNGKPYVNQIVMPNGSEIKFFFHEQEELSFESIEVEDLIFDEPPPRRIYVALLRGMRNRNKEARVLIIGTPLSAAWLRKEIYQPWAAGELTDTTCFKFSTRVNEVNLPEGYVDWYASKLSEKERSIRIDGQFFDLDGLALSHLFDRKVHIIPKAVFEWDRSLPTVISIDPHPSKNHVVSLVGADKRGPVYIKELSLKATPRDFARELKKFMQGYRVMDIICDSLGSSEMTGGEGFASFIEVLRSEGIQVRATTYDDKSDEDWINRIQNVLEVPKEEDNYGERIPALRIVEGNHGIINDIETVEWGRRRGSDDFKVTLDISRKDFLATLKYALATNLTHTKKKDKVYYYNKPAYGVNLKHERQIKEKVHLDLGLSPRKDSKKSWKEW
jgi:hypothetical protein